MYLWCNRLYLVYSTYFLINSTYSFFKHYSPYAPSLYIHLRPRTFIVLHSRSCITTPLPLFLFHLLFPPHISPFLLYSYSVLSPDLVCLRHCSLTFLCSPFLVYSLLFPMSQIWNPFYSLSSRPSFDLDSETFYCSPLLGFYSFVSAKICIKVASRTPIQISSLPPTLCRINSSLRPQVYLCDFVHLSLQVG